MLFRIDKPKQFEYRYRVYKPENDEGRKRIEFRRLRSGRYSQKASILRMVLLLIFLIYLFIVLQRPARDVARTSQDSDTIIVEEVIVID